MDQHTKDRLESLLKHLKITQEQMKEYHSVRLSEEPRPYSAARYAGQTGLAKQALLQAQMEVEVIIKWNEILEEAK